MIRLISRVDTRNDFHIKTINCEGVQPIRSIKESITLFSSGDYEFDEIILIDSVASLYKRANWLLRESFPHIYCPLPLAIGGGISSAQAASLTLQKGADKVVVNSSALLNSHILTDISNICGSQAVVLQIDTRYIHNDYYCFYNGGRELSTIKLSEWLNLAPQLGVGEVHLTCIDTEGTNNPFPFPLVELAVNSTHLPIILSGGFRDVNHIEAIYSRFNITAFSLSSMPNILQVPTILLRQQLLDLGLPVRIPLNQ